MFANKDDQNLSAFAEFVNKLDMSGNVQINCDTIHPLVIAAAIDFDGRPTKGLYEEYITLLQSQIVSCLSSLLINSDGVGGGFKRSDTGDIVMSVDELRFFAAFVATYAYLTHDSLSSQLEIDIPAPDEKWERVVDLADMLNRTIKTMYGGQELPTVCDLMDDALRAIRVDR